MQKLGFTRLGSPDGRPLALIHGWGCDSSFLLPVAYMFPERDVYLIDLPGYGASAHLADYASDLISTTYMLINTLPDGADVMSWSLGTLYTLHALSIINDPMMQQQRFTSARPQNLTAHSLCPSMTPPCVTPDSRNAGSFGAQSLPFCPLSDPVSAQSSFVREKIQEKIMVSRELNRSARDRKNSAAITLSRCPAAPCRTDGILEIPQNPPSQAAVFEPSVMIPDPYFTTIAERSFDDGAQNPSQQRASLLKLTPRRRTENTDSLPYASALAVVRIPKIRSLVTICGTPRFPSDPNWPGIDPAHIVKIRTGLTQRRLKSILNLFYRMQFASDVKSHPETARYLNRCVTVEERVLRAGIQQISFMDERESFAHLRTPSLHLFGAKDRLVPRAVAAKCPHNSLHSVYVFAHSSHNPFITESFEFEKQIRRFFDMIRHI